MSYKAEFFNGHWYDEGLVFASRQEAQDYAVSRHMVPYRVTSATEQSDPSGATRTLDVNYQFKGGKLEPYKPPLLKKAISWEDYVLAGGIVPWVVPDSVMCVIRPRPLCWGCGNEIDPDCCGCGDPKENHNDWMQGHSFVPMGCDCMRDDGQRLTPDGAV